MKKSLILTLLFFSSLLCFGGVLHPSLWVSEELSSFCYNGVSEGGRNDYSVSSVSSSPLLNSSLDISIMKACGFSLRSSLGWRYPIYDENIFVTFPSHINSTLGLGAYYSFGKMDLSLFLALRSSYFSARSTWLSEMGGIGSLSYTFSSGITIRSEVLFLFGRDIRTLGFSLGAGYKFGVRK